MNAKKFSDAMSELDNKYIDEAVSYSCKIRQTPRFNRRLTAALIAAMITLFLMGCAAVVAGVFGTWVTDFFTSQIEPGTDYEQSGYNLDVVIEKIPMSDFSEEIQQVGAVIQQQFKDYKAYDSWYPGLWQADFSSREKACEYIGLDRLKQIDLTLEEQETTLNVSGNEEGQILSLLLETDYSADDITVQFFSQIYTENYKEEITIGTRTTESVEFEESFYITDSNQQCHIIDSTALESGYRCLDGYIVDNGVLYNLHIAYQEEASEQAIELIHLWADLF